MGTVDSLKSETRSSSVLLPENSNSRQSFSRKSRILHSAKIYCLSVGKRFILYVVVAACFILAFISLNSKLSFETYDYSKAEFNWKYDPRSKGLVPYDNKLDDYNILLDAHSHTTSSDGRLSPKQLVDLAISNGYNAIIVSDHNTISGGLKAEKYAKEAHPNDIIVIPAMEYS
ncbi:PHP domain-containing protein [Smittium mucronatum]|uniref:PHP domain-containing protein n=1 Tax=Smittium mucronatum TaxID=133383 RepID=A0A1R0GYI2_9FUNG|nr:PHP domain-containing protein [Smittium mucronatum]